MSGSLNPALDGLSQGLAAQDKRGMEVDAKRAFSRALWRIICIRRTIHLKGKSLTWNTPISVDRNPSFLIVRELQECLVEDCLQCLGEQRLLWKTIECITVYSCPDEVRCCYRYMHGSSCWVKRDTLWSKWVQQSAWCLTSCQSGITHTSVIWVLK